MLLMVEKETRGRICHAIHRYAKGTNKYMKNYDKNKDSSYLIYLNANNLYDREMSQKLSVDGFEWIKNTSKFNGKFIKDYDENSGKGYILEADVEHLKSLHNLHNVYHFYQKK